MGRLEETTVSEKKHIFTSDNFRQIWQIIMQASAIGIHNTTRPA